MTDGLVNRQQAITTACAYLVVLMIAKQRCTASHTITNHQYDVF
ncbi:MAG: hypothetical protein OFPII_18460 [Osedax symbiont Rs1]|nr:MAG: hypothetical protein OFPII_18460 [Osedax symbiont Rs1]